VKNDEALAARQYLDLNSHESFEPLIFMGRVSNIELEPGEVCEVWLAACGARAYHFHLQDEARFDTYAGGDPIKRGKDAGRVYIVLTSPNQLWYLLAIRSFVAAFDRAERYAVNFGFPGDAPAIYSVRRTEEAPPKDLERVRSVMDQEHKNNFAVQAGFEQRFLAKLALGLGANLFGTAFLDTPYAKLLRTALWERDLEKRAKLPVRGTGFFDDSKTAVDDLISWPGAYTLLLLATRDAFVLRFHFPSGRPMRIVISDTPELWANAKFQNYRDGEVFIILPQASKFVGPVSMRKYLGHQLKKKAVPELKAIEGLRIDPATLPPCSAAENSN
jgi:hypothetical protein